jgi:hypothetical protein
MTSRRLVRRNGVWLGVAALVAAVLGYGNLYSGAKESDDPGGMPLEKVADLVHAVIQADRTVYTTHVVERMQEKGVTLATENWEQQNALPLPAQLLNYAGRLAAEGGSGIRFGLISLWPIRNGPGTDFERKALEALVTKPNTPITGTVTSGRKRYFQAIYADRAISNACVTCHNAHLRSPKRDFKLNDVMGGIVITLPLGK